MSRSSAYLSGLLAIALTALACGGDSLSPPTTGTLEVTTSTAGVEPDQDGYSLSLDAEPAQPIGPAATVQTADITPGNHTVQLAGIAGNCTLAGENPRTVNIAAGETTTVSFAVSCSATTGSVQVSSSSSGPSPDADGYTLTLDGSERGTLGTSGGVSVDALLPGDHLVGLSGVAGNCQVQGDNPRTVTVTAGQSTEVTFTVTCSPPPANTGALRIAAATTGPDPDPNGYTFAVDGGTTQSLAVNAKATLTNVSVGAHSVRLSGVAGNCAVQGTNPRSATVSSGATADVNFAIMCTATTGSLEITTTTTGARPDPDGYAVSVDGGSAQPTAINSTLTLPSVPAGSHAVALAGLAGNCAVQGENPQQVTVVVGQRATVSFSVSCPAATARYRAIDLLGAPSGANGINPAGQVVGYIETGGDGHAFLWSSGVTTDLGTLGGGISSATDINSRGQVVGSSLTEVGETNAFLWENGVMTNVGFFDFARATGINSRGDVAGNFGQGGGLGAFLRLDGVIHRLEPQEPDGFIQVADINSRRQVVGFSDGGAVLWENGVITGLGPGFANAINDSGQVVGGSFVGSSHAFLWDNGVFTDLGTLGGDISVALGINGSGQVVGRSETAAGQTHAFLWEKGVMTDLGTLGGSQSVASAINDAGQIVGSSETASGETRATLWIRE